MNTSTFFDDYYHNAVLNCLLIMDDKGIILGTNQAFSNNFGYSNNELNGQNFNVLFNLSHRNQNKPEAELENVLNRGNAFDENYILNKEGKEIWVTGESMLTVTKTGAAYIVKDVINLQSKKQLELLHIETEELMERIFEGKKDTAMVVLDGGGKIIKLNQPFLNLFEIAKMPLPGSRLSQLNHIYWSAPDIRKEIRSILVRNIPPEKNFTLETKKGEKIILNFIVKVLGREERKIYIIIEESTKRIIE
jgi:PAS domain S-box-containing protein